MPAFKRIQVPVLSLHGVVFDIFGPGPPAYPPKPVEGGVKAPAEGAARRPPLQAQSDGTLLRLALRADAGDPGPDTRAAFGLLDIEGFRLADEVAEFAVAVGANVEIGKQIGELRADLP